MIFFTNDQNRNPKKELLVFVLVLILMGSIAWLLQSNRKNLLEDYIVNTGRVKSKSSSYLGRDLIFIEHKVQGELIESNGFQKEDCFDGLRVGDSVKIKYSKSSPNVVDITDCEPMNR